MVNRTHADSSGWTKTVKSASPDAVRSESRAPLGPAQKRHLALLTLGALTLYVGMRLLPIGTNLGHGDFRVTGGNAIEMCDPARPAFIPVVNVRSPVDLKLAPVSTPAVGEPTRFALRMLTISGKPVGPRDLAISHTELLHLLVVDPSLGDYQHVHPVPGREYGTWEFEITPRRAGLYRVFADFVPIATGLGLYAHADFTVAGERAATIEPLRTSVVDGYNYEFVLRGGALRARDDAELDLRITSATPGARVPLEPVMGAFAHVVAFDPERNGFAHLHPLAADPLAPPDATAPVLAFRVTIPQPGRYIVWAQVRMEGRDRFAPFSLEVAP
jgi:hypothetical protein